MNNQEQNLPQNNNNVIRIQLHRRNENNEDNIDIEN